ncbi:unnamed protein product [Boreogadus saida]
MEISSAKRDIDILGRTEQEPGGNSNGGIIKAHEQNDNNIGANAISWHSEADQGSTRLKRALQTIDHGGCGDGWRAGLPLAWLSGLLQRAETGLPLAWPVGPAGLQRAGLPLAWLSGLLQRAETGLPLAWLSGPPPEG